MWNTNRRIIIHSVIYIYFESQQITVVKFSAIDFMGFNKKNNRVFFSTPFFSKTSSIKIEFGQRFLFEYKFKIIFFSML